MTWADLHPFESRWDPVIGAGRIAPPTRSCIRATRTDVSSPPAIASRRPSAIASRTVPVNEMSPDAGSRWSARPSGLQRCFLRARRREAARASGWHGCGQYCWPRSHRRQR